MCTLTALPITAVHEMPLIVDSWIVMDAMAKPGGTQLGYESIQAAG